MDTLQVNRNAIYLCDNFNIDLLKIYTKIHYNTFYNNIIAAGYLPRISLPTRVSNHSATQNKLPKPSIFFSLTLVTLNTLNANQIADFEQYMPAKPNCNLKYQSVTFDNVSRTIDSMKPKTSSSVDNISNKLIKYVKYAILELLTVFINQMLIVGIIPDLLKNSKVIPVYKKKMITQSFITIVYRPISLLPSISKIFEKIILEQITTYLDSNNLIHKHQYGFRKNHSTEYAALHIVIYLNYEMD